MALIGNLSAMFKKPAARDGMEQGDTVAVHELPSTTGSEYGSVDLESVAPLPAASDVLAHEADDAFPIPGLGTRTAAQHQRVLSIVLAAALLALAVVVFWMVSSADRTAQQVGATGQALMQSQRLAKSVSQALVGSPRPLPR
jgi:twitching motility protein PilJ